MIDNKKKEYESKRNELMEKWMSKYKAKDGEVSFAKDGIVYPDIWFRLRDDEERILVILKEAYIKAGKKYVWDESNWIAKKPCVDNISYCPHNGKQCKSIPCDICGATGNTFNPVAEWVYGIRNVKSNRESAYDNWLGIEKGTKCRRRLYKEKRDSLLKEIAVMNIKKAKGNPRSDSKDIIDIAEDDKCLIAEQIELIAPTVIICGGTYEYLRKVYPDLPDEKSIADTGTVYGKYKIISVCHPNARLKGQEKYDCVMKQYKHQ